MDRKSVYCVITATVNISAQSKMKMSNPNGRVRTDNGKGATFGRCFNSAQYARMSFSWFAGAL